MKREQKKNIEQLEKVVEEKKKIPKSVKEKINSKVFENIIIAAIFIVYFGSLSFGMDNIPTDMYLNDLRIFSILLLATTIILFEYGYKKDNGEIWIHGVEVMAVAIFTLYLIYLYSIYYATYSILLFIAGLIALVYYAIKIVITQRMVETSYKKSLRDIPEIVKNKGGK